MKSGQAWSIDAIVGVSLFIVIVIAVLAFSMSQGKGSKTSELQMEGERIYSSLSSNDAGQIVDERKVDPEALLDLSQMSYVELKNKMGLKNDFCIYFVDERGNLQYIDDEGKIVGIGSSKVTINGVRCNSS